MFIVIRSCCSTTAGLQGWYFLTCVLDTLGLSVRVVPSVFVLGNVRLSHSQFGPFGSMNGFAEHAAWRAQQQGGGGGGGGGFQQQNPMMMAPFQGSQFNQGYTPPQQMGNGFRRPPPPSSRVTEKECVDRR